jgi:serine/threonine protein phosphatase PrpC
LNSIKINGVAAGFHCKAAALTDIGRCRSSNQDEVICCPESGFFAVSDGMGGLRNGGETSALIAQTLPGLIRKAAETLDEPLTPERAAVILEEQVRALSDQIAESLNKGKWSDYGATLSGVWLVGDKAVFVNIGDSRGYLLGYYTRQIRQITKDHNVAARLVDLGRLSPEEARNHPSSSRLTSFVGISPPARIETFIEPVSRGDRILLCSDGLYGMIEDDRLSKLLRSFKSAERVTSNLVDAANAAGGRDNIAAVYIKIVGCL